MLDIQTLCLGDGLDHTQSTGSYVGFFVDSDSDTAPVLNMTESVLDAGFGYFDQYENCLDSVL